MPHEACLPCFARAKATDCRAAGRAMRAGLPPRIFSHYQGISDCFHNAKAALEQAALAKFSSIKSRQPRFPHSAGR